MKNLVLGQARRRRQERGAVAVELVLVLPFIFILIFLIAELTGALKTWMVVENASREGARLAIVFPRATTAQVQQRVVDTAVNAGVTTSQVTVTYASPSRQPGSNVEVRVQYTYQFRTPLARIFTGFFGGAIPSSMSMNARTHMRLE